MGEVNTEFGFYTKMRADSWIVKGSVPTGRGYLLSKSEGFSFFNTFITKDKLEEALRSGVTMV
jgi:hypothetical protein